MDRDKKDFPEGAFPCEASLALNPLHPPKKPAEEVAPSEATANGTADDASVLGQKRQLLEADATEASNKRAKTAEDAIMVIEDDESAATSGIISLD